MSVDYGPVHRAEVRNNRAIANGAQPVFSPTGKTGNVTADDYNALISDDADKEFYCPACGRRYTYMRECVGRAEAPHPAVELAPTAELAGDPADHTAAPNTDVLAKV